MSHRKKIIVKKYHFTFCKNMLYYMYKIQKVMEKKMDDIFKSQCYSLPKFLFSKKYNKVEMGAKLLYSVIFSNFLAVLSDDKKLARFRDRDGCFIMANLSLLADLFFCNSRTIYTWFRTLEKVGLIETRHARRIGGKLVKKVYFNL